MIMNIDDAKEALSRAADGPVGAVVSAMVHILRDLGVDTHVSEPHFSDELWYAAREVLREQRTTKESQRSYEELEGRIALAVELAWRAGYGEAARRAAADDVSMDEQEARESVASKHLLHNILLECNR